MDVDVPLREKNLMQLHNYSRNMEEATEEETLEL